MYKLLLGLLLLLICACDSSPGENGSHSKGSSAQEVTGSTCPANGQQNAPDNFRDATGHNHAAPPTQEELDKADRIIAYNNRVNEELDNGFYRLGNTFYNNSQRYMQTWQLPARPQTRKRANLAPEEGLFNETEAALITSGLKRMDKALDNLLGHYESLEKYIADDRIRDDGKQGLKLGAQIKKDHATFIAARDSWLETVRKRAAEAEKILLYGHPLQRQIMAGNMILSQLREVSNIISSGSREPDLLRACGQNIVAAIDEGSRPPFPARPALERLYRSFLKSAATYRELLEMAVNEGLHQTQLRQIQDSAHACANAWNEFVKEANAGVK